MVIRQTEDGMKAIVMPTWAWSIVGSVLFIMLGGTVTAATWVGSSIIDHEKRVSIIEANKFTANDAANLYDKQQIAVKEALKDLQIEIKELRKSISEISKVK